VAAAPCSPSGAEVAVALLQLNSAKELASALPDWAAAEGGRLPRGLAVAAEAEAAQHPSLAVVAEAVAAQHPSLAVVAEAVAAQHPSLAAAEEVEAAQHPSSGVAAEVEAAQHPSLAVVAEAEARAPHRNSRAVAAEAHRGSVAVAGVAVRHGWRCPEPATQQGVGGVEARGPHWNCLTEEVAVAAPNAAVSLLAVSVGPAASSVAGQARRRPYFREEAVERKTRAEAVEPRGPPLRPGFPRSLGRTSWSVHRRHRDQTRLCQSWCGNSPKESEEGSSDVERALGFTAMALPK
jgi:hypothetical protein